jgi:hypothetical protein
MVIPIGLQADKFHIGRSGAEEENDFELDGMGIQEKHCEMAFTKQGAVVKSTIRACSSTAQTTLNGMEVKTDAEPLQHLDRIVFGPCRMLCLYLTAPLTLQQRQDLTSVVFHGLSPPLLNPPLRLTLPYL